MKRLSHFSFVPLLIILSCDAIYHSSSVNTTILEEKGDMGLQATGRVSNLLSIGGAFNLGYANAFSNKYAAIVNLEYQNEEITTNSLIDGDHFKNQLAEVYVGRYFSTERTNTAFYLGCGRGYLDKKYVAYVGHHANYAADYTLLSAFFKQTFRKKDPDTRQKWLFTYFFRVSYIHNYNIQAYTSNPEFQAGLLNHKDMFSIGPGANIARNLGRVNLFMQGSFAFNPVDLYEDYTDEEYFYTTQPIFLLGINYNLNHKKH